MGHSAGGVFTQLLMDRGYGAAGVAINSAPTEGVKRCRCHRSGRASPSSRTPPTGTRPSGSPSSNGATRSRTRSARRRREGSTSATTSPHRAACSGAVRSRTSIRGQTTRTWTTRTPTGRRCSSSPAARITSCPRRSNARTRSTTRRRARSPRSRNTRAEHTFSLSGGLGRGRRLRPGVGARSRDDARHVVRRPRVSDIRITHIGGPTALIEIGGWRLLTDPTFDPPGRRYSFGWGTSSRKLAGPAIAAADLPPIDAVLLTHEHHGDNLDPCRTCTAARGRRRHHHRLRRNAPRGAPRAGSSRGRRRGSTNQGGRRSRSPPRPAAMARL